MNVLSLFDGISCGQVALERAGIKLDTYFASEIKDYAIKITQHNYPNTIQLGKVEDININKLPDIDLLIGGSPCQDISGLSQKGKGLEGNKSSLFFEYLRILKETKPKYFLLENVQGRKNSINTISEMLGVKPIMIDSRLISAQKRRRNYWTNIPNITQPEDKQIKLKDILEDNVDEKYFLKDGRLNWILGENGQKCLTKRYASLDAEKANCLTVRGEPSWNCNYITQNNKIRKLTPIECERLQTIPDNYTSCVSDKYRYDVLGDGWTVDVIVHILKNIIK